MFFVLFWHNAIGSVRVAFTPTTNGNTVVQENAYYPFGAVINELSYNAPLSTNRYKREGKEYISDFSWNKYDYTARTFDPWNGQALQLDPLAEAKFWLSPYNLFSNNPVGRIDPNGMLDDWYRYEDEKPIWRPSSEKRITENGKTYDNIGTMVSMQQENGTFLNYYQNIAFRSDQPLNAMQHILDNGLAPQYMGAKSGLWEPAKSALMPALMRKGQEDFLNHPATQIVSIFTSLPGAVEGVVSIATGIRSLLTAIKGAVATAKGPTVYTQF